MIAGRFYGSNLLPGHVASTTVAAIVNTIYGRWWHPLDEKPGANPLPGSPPP